MTGNALLLHLNEASGQLVDSSGQANHATSQGGVYAAAGRYKTAMDFTNSTAEAEF